MTTNVPAEAAQSSEFNAPELLKAAVSIIAKKYDVRQEAAMQIVVDELNQIDILPEQAISSAEMWMWQNRQSQKMFEDMQKAFEESRKPKVEKWKEQAKKWYLF